jgi:hypothetical protein
MAFTDSGYASSVKYPAKIQPIEKGSQRHADRPASAQGESGQDDTRTEYSAATTITPTHVQTYLSELSRDIYSRLGRHFDLNTWPSLATMLPGLIKAFALRIGREDSSQMHRDIMYFVYRRHG